MKKNKNTESEDLRQQAEALLKKNARKTSATHSEIDMLSLIHELEVHQVELEIQNDELQRAKELADIAVDKYTDLYDFAPSGYLTLSKNGDIVGLNLESAKMLGQERSKIMNKRFGLFVSSDTRSLFNQFLGNAFEGKRQETCEVALSNDGDLPTYVLLTGILTEKKELCSVAMVDITERKQAEELAESHSLKELLLDIITHDLKNPAGVIYALSEAIRQDIPENNHLEAIYSSSGRLLDVLKQTTIISQAVLGEAIQKKALSLNTLIKETAAVFELELSAAGMDLEIDMPANVIIEANPLIGEVFKNYISNAIKYARIEDHTVVVRVKDFGETIAEADRDLIFTRRTQLENGSKRGRGLGLAIVKRIALAHDGKVWVEPNTPVGNNFCIRIPL
jgi:PAS domain S-box-containing protein